MTTTYETLSGTNPDPDEQHEARVIRAEREGITHMLTEIGDGTFVAWTDCATCRNRVPLCACPQGPVEPTHIERWRLDRFTSSFDGRGAEPPLPLALKERDRQVAAVMRLLLSRGYAIVAPDQLDGLREAAQEAQDAALGDSNDREIELLREALDACFAAFRVDLPEGRDPDEEDADDDAIIDPDDIRGESDDPDYGGHVEPIAPEVDDGLTAAIERLKHAKEKKGNDVGI